MKTLLKLLAMVVPAALFTAAAMAKEETVFLFENRKVVIALPEGFAGVAEKDDNGLVILRFADPAQKFSGEIRFLPDPEERFLQSRARKEMIHEMFGDYVESSTEKGIQFEELEPRVGKATYCVFTDSSLVGKTKLPPGEYLNLTAGLKAWRGVVAIFRFFSNETTSPEYQAILRMLRESVEERGVPLK